MILKHRYAPLQLLRLLIVTTTLTACSANIKETHYFGLYRVDSNMPVNFYKVEVTAKTNFTNARYVAGYYDERAVDLFFNELKPTAPPKPFDGSLKDPGTQALITPLSPAAGKGRFVMILSTNADEIATTLGALTENEAAMQALSNLVNRDDMERMQWSEAGTVGDKLEATALKQSLQALANGLSDSTDLVAAQGTALRMINALYTVIDKSPPFSSLEDAEVWLRRARIEQ